MVALHVSSPALWCDVFLHVVFALHVPVHGVALAAGVLAQPAPHGLLVGVQHGVNLEVLQLPEHLSTTNISAGVELTQHGVNLEVLQLPEHLSTTNISAGVELTQHGVNLEVLQLPEHLSSSTNR